MRVFAPVLIHDKGVRVRMNSARVLPCRAEHLTPPFLCRAQPIVLFYCIMVAHERPQREESGVKRIGLLDKLMSIAITVAQPQDLTRQPVEINRLIGAARRRRKDEG
jgi:hypothetical protein